jgi:hypothetical protein
MEKNGFGPREEPVPAIQRIGPLSQGLEKQATAAVGTKDGLGKDASPQGPVGRSRTTGAGPVVSFLEVARMLSAQSSGSQGATIGSGELREGSDMEVKTAPIEPLQFVLIDQLIDEDVHQKAIVRAVQGQGRGGELDSNIQGIELDPDSFKPCLRRQDPSVGRLLLQKRVGRSSLKLVRLEVGFQVLS